MLYKSKSRVGESKQNESTGRTPEATLLPIIQFSMSRTSSYVIVSQPVSVDVNKASPALPPRWLFYTNLWNFPIDYLHVALTFFNRLSWNYGQLRNLLRSPYGGIFVEFRGKIASQMTKMFKIIDFLPLAAMFFNRLKPKTIRTVYSTRALYL